MSNSSQLFASPADALRALFRAWPSDRGDGTGLSEAYIIAIKGYSLKAVEGAVMRLIRGEVDDVDKRFLPTPAQLGNLAAYMEKLYAPPAPRQALPAPGDEVRTPEEQARVDAIVARARAAFGIKSQKGETVVDREAIPEAKRKELDREMKAVTDRIASEGLPKLSAEARALFREQSERAVPTPAEQFDEWDRRPSPLSTQDERNVA